MIWIAFFKILSKNGFGADIVPNLFNPFQTVKFLDIYLYIMSKEKNKSRPLTLENFRNLGSMVKVWKNGTRVIYVGDIKVGLLVISR